jgi:hypothetical protein
MRTLSAPARARPNPRPLAALLGLVPACGITNPLGQATSEPATETGETGATTDDTPTTGTTESPVCDGDGECDPGEDAQNCPEDCDSPPGCGDSSVDGAEVCDVGASNGMYGHCNAGCSAVLECGDGVKNGPEVCDDGADNSDEYSPSAHCNADCSGDAPNCGDGECQAGDEDTANCPDDCPPPMCGNGVQEPGELCDDGAESAACNADCTIAACGDGYVNSAADETCDDSNADDSDMCPSSCQDAVCGDGFVLAGVEPCDDGDQDNANECGNACELPRRVFASSLTKNGAFLGVDGADLICQTLADTAMLSGTYRAWLSDALEGPAQRFDTAFTGAYKLVDGTVVAIGGWDDLTDGILEHAIDRSETGAQVGGTAWTNTLSDGASASAMDCGGWTSAAGTSAVGDLGATDGTWTDLGGGQFCSNPFRFYCFEN